MRSPNTKLPSPPEVTEVAKAVFKEKSPLSPEVRDTAKSPPLKLAESASVTVTSPSWSIATVPPLAALTLSPSRLPTTGGFGVMATVKLAVASGSPPFAVPSPSSSVKVKPRSPRSLGAS